MDYYKIIKINNRQYCQKSNSDSDMKEKKE